MRRFRGIGFVRHIAALGALLVFQLAACSGKCPAGTVAQGKFCRKESALTADAAVDEAGGPGSSGSGGVNPIAAGTGAIAAAAGRAGTSGSGGSMSPPIDPATQWMCMKNNFGECTSCKQDTDCSKRVCEQGFCMDCRDTSQCNADESCISNRCVPERKPSSIWTTSGGGQTTTAGFKLQLSIGTPSPAGNAAASGYKVSLAPGAGLF
jgi:hypothetical protein